jgi:hypothetical protein
VKDEARNWLTKWKLLGSPSVLSPEMMVTLPAEAFDQVDHFECDLSGETWAVADRGKHFFTVGVRGAGSIDEAGALHPMFRRKRWEDARRLLHQMFDYPDLVKGVRESVR